MLKRIEQTGHQSSASKSAIKQMRNSFLCHSLYSQNQLNEIWPKKANVSLLKIRAGVEAKGEHIIIDKQEHFIYINKQLFPNLRTLHSYPDMYPRFQVDEGAIRFILKGANVMAPGLLNQHSKMDEVQSNSIVIIYAFGLEHALGIGVTQMSTEEIRENAEGMAVELVHYVGDGFWNMLFVNQFQ